MAGSNIAAATILAPKILASTQIGSTSPTSVYTVPVGGSAIIKHGVVSNVSGETKATPSSTLCTGSATTTLAVSALAVAIPSGATLVVSSGANAQTWVTSASAAVGATSLTVTSQTPNFAYTSGTVLTTVAQPVLVSLSLIPSGGTADGTHALFRAYQLASGDALALAEVLGGSCLGPGDAVSVTASVASTVNVTLTGTEHA